MSKSDILLSLFLEGETGLANIDTRKYEKNAWTIEDYDQAVALLQYGLRYIYGQRNQLIKEKKAIESEINKLTK